MPADHLNSLKSNIWKYYVFSSLMSINFFMPIVVVFFLSNNLSFTQIMLLQTVYSVVIVLMEVPTGAVADVMGRKVSILAGAILTAGGCALYATGYSFYQFIVAEITWGVGSTFLSGALSAFLYETLQELEISEQYKKIDGKASMIALISVAGSSLVGGYLGDIHLRIPFYVTVACFSLSVFFALRFTEPKKTRESKISLRHYVHVIKLSSIECITNARIRWILLCSAGLNTFILIARWFYQPYMQDIGIDITYFGVVFMGFSLFAALNSRYAYKYEGKVGNKFYLPLMFLLLSVSFLFMGLLPIIVSIMFMFLQQGMRGSISPIIKYYINEEVSSDKRATVLSFHALFNRGLFALGAPAAGWVADEFSVNYLYLCCGIVLLVYFLIVLRMRSNGQ